MRGEFAELVRLAVLLEVLFAVLLEVAAEALHKWAARRGEDDGWQPPEDVLVIIPHAWFPAPAAPAPSAAGTVCPACHTPLPEGAKFCFNCGASLDSGRVCPVCGNKLMPGAKFCMNCGAKLEKVCPQCGKPVQEGTKFCMNCGFKLEA